MKRILKTRVYPDRNGDHYYRKNRAWRIGTATTHLSIPKPGSGLSWSVQLGHTLWVLVRRNHRTRNPGPPRTKTWTD